LGSGFLVGTTSLLQLDENGHKFTWTQQLKTTNEKKDVFEKDVSEGSFDAARCIQREL
jgi:hypothetical protein